MKKWNIFFIMVFLLLGNVQQTAAKATFKFPARIKYKLLKNDNIVGNCFLIYEKKTDKPGISSLRLTKFQGFGLTSQEQFLTYIYTKHSSLYAQFLLKGGTEIRQIRLKKGLTFDLKKENVFIYQEKAKPQMQTELFTKYPVIDLLSTFFVTSERVASGNYKKGKMHNLIFDKSTKIAKMKYLGPEDAPYKGEMVSTEVISITINNVEMFRLKIYDNGNGYYFPVSITITEGTGTFEMRADRISK